MDSTLPIINKTYEAYKAIIDLNNKLEKRWRNSLGLGLENSVLDCMEILVMAKSAPKPLKAGYLLKAIAKLEISTLKLRLLLELKLVNETKLFQLQAKLAEIGRMLGGWLKATQST
ncbi:four helix bundle protein [Candidatus Peregrinibacteria bacterium]|nr:four helix bundle protein [Candidatus Peregrinibacteria bacterium]